MSTEASFLDEEDQRRAKKNEEVAKNIERARRRREEEEQKYNKGGPQYDYSQPLFGRNHSEDSRLGREGGYYNRNQSARPLLNDDRGQLNNRRSPGNYRISHNNNERNIRDDNDRAGNRSSFGKFDVLGGTSSQQPYNDHEKQGTSDSYEDKPVNSNERKQIQILQPPQHSQYDSGGGYAPRKQLQQSSVPPRFKRHGAELHAFRRSSPPKETSTLAQSANDVDSNDIEDKEASPSSGRSQSSKEKEFGSLRSSSGTSSNRKSPGTWDRHSNHSNSGSTVGCSIEKEDNDRNSTSSKDEHRKDSTQHLQSNAITSGRPFITDQGRENSTVLSYHDKDTGYDNSEGANLRLSQERSSTERMHLSSHNDRSRSPNVSGNNNENVDEYRNQRDNRARPNDESYQSYDENRMEQSYHMTKRPGTTNPNDRRENNYQHQGRFDHRFDRDRRDRNNKMGKPHNDDFRDRRDREYDIERNRDKFDRDNRSSRGGRSNRDNRGIYASRSESNVPSSLTKPPQQPNAGLNSQKKIVLPVKSPQGRNQQLLEAEPQESPNLNSKPGSAELDNAHVTKDIESKMANLMTNQVDVISSQPNTSVAQAVVPSEQAQHEILPSEKNSNSENTLEFGEGYSSNVEIPFTDGSQVNNQLDNKNNSGWFAARGQPSRRGRGGLTNSAVGRSFTKTDPEASTNISGFVDSATSDKHSRASVPRTAEDWETASDKSYEESSKKGTIPQSLDDKYYDRSKQVQKDKFSAKDMRKSEKDDRYRRSDGTHESHFTDSGSFGDNRRRIERDDNRRGKYEIRGGMDRGDKRMQMAERNNQKQQNYDNRNRHPKQLPPRLAKQKEASRVMGGLSNSQIEGTGWGTGDGVNEASSYQTWEQNANQHNQIPNSQNATLQSQQRPNQMITGEYTDHSSIMQQTRYGEGGSVSMSASGDNMHNNAPTNESQHSAAPPVQTIIFENTNLKGGRGNAMGISHAMTSGTTSVNDKLVFKSSVHSSAGGVGDLKPDPIQMPPIGGFGVTKNEDSDLKLDFTFEPDVDVDKGVDNKTGSIVGTGNAPRSTSNQHPTEDLSAKIANVKKVWEMPSMSPVPHSDSGTSNANFNQGFANSALGSNEEKGYRQPGSSSDVNLDGDNAMHGVSSTGNANAGGSTNAYSNLTEKNEGITPNVAKVRPQQVQNQHISHPHLSQGHQQAASLMQAQALEERVAAISRSSTAAVVGPNNGNAANGNSGNRFTSAAGLTIGSGAIPALQSQQIINQAPSLYQAFQLDHAGRGGMTTNPLYSAYAGLGGQSVLLSSSGLSPGNGNMFGASAPGNQFRLQDAGNATQFPGAAQQSSGNAVLLSQSNLMSSAMKQSNQIGPIGTKGGNGPFQQSGIGTLPASGTSPLHLIQSDGQGYINYMTPNAMQRSTAGQGPGQTAFHQALAASTQQPTQQVVSRQQGVTQQAAGIFSNVQGYGSQQGLTQQQQMNQAAQLRNQAVAAAAAAGAHLNVSGIPYSREQAAAVAAAMKQQAQGGVTRSESFGSVQTNSATLHGNSMTGQTNLGQLQNHHFQQQMQSKVSMNTVQMANMSSFVNATGNPTNRPSGPTYSPTPIQRPHIGQGN